MRQESRTRCNAIKGYSIGITIGNDRRGDCPVMGRERPQIAKLLCKLFKLNPEKKYTRVAELLSDDGFLAWYLKTNSRQSPAWNRWVRAGETHAQLAKNAGCILSALLAPPAEDLSAGEISAAFDKIYKKINPRPVSSGFIKS